MTARQRSLAAKSIADLEALHAASGNDPKVLRMLREELAHRSTERARKLRARVGTSAPPAPVRAPVTRPAAPVTPSPPEPPRPCRKRPPRPDEPDAILSAWTALEALSPQTYRTPENCAGDDRSRVAFLDDGLPWTRGERSRPDKQLYYQLALGSVRMDAATQRLVRAFGADEERRDRAREKAILAAVLVDRHGCLLTDRSIAVSSFGWALPLALDLRLGELGDWSAVERRTVQTLHDMLRRKNDQGQPMPLDAGRIETAFRWLVETFRLPQDLVEPPAFAVRIYHYYRASDPPEVALLNSFFLTDLSRAQALDPAAVPVGLKRYLGSTPSEPVFDLQLRRSALEAAVAPKLIPAARWPSPGGHPLVLLQQAAVNLARREPATGGLLAVNGPPGTGKTTLLRDIVAGAVLDRAVAMAGFADPADAMTPSGQKVKFGPNAFFHIYQLAPGLRGHEVLVASSNNKAVENVSRELPAAKAIGRPADACGYFRSVSDHVHAVAEEGKGEGEGAAETWGLIAAVLGNAGNRFRFGQRFWWDQDRGFRVYLKAAKGDDVVREVKDEEDRVIRRETPSVVLSERPPAPGTALRAWQRARTRFNDLHREVTAELAALETVRQTCLTLVTRRRALHDAEAVLPPLIRTHDLADGQEQYERIPLADAAMEQDRSTVAVNEHRHSRPGLFARLFRTARWQAWSTASAMLDADAARASTVFAAAERTHAAAVAARDTAAAALVSARKAREAVAGEVARLASVVDGHRMILGDRIVDDAFFARGHEASNLAAPWVPDALHAKREDLFLAALDLHRAFIDGAAGKVLHNLSILMDVMAKGPPKDPAKLALLGELWSTLFLVVPVLSTTFASVDAMFGELGSDAFGWLLIDEAGQALPQAAVGAVMRATRTVVVGDPLQVPPVVSLPDRLTQEICSWFNVSTDAWGAPEASAQTVADRASQFRGGFDGDRGRREVGVPLLVHRRCQEPMFGISNAIAYDRQMVFAAGPRAAGQVGDVLGPSAWFDVDGDATTKWCPAEGECVIELLRALTRAGVRRPDLFIVTPFRIVAHEMRRRIEREGDLLSALGLERGWLNDRVGTVHTVQGREAETVIVVLGAPAAEQGGARSWAAGTPNILNVAVSRTKQNLYVVGSYGAWAGVGHAAELRQLPRLR
ncbi:DEAD/DEAH box helicase [Sphingomonas sp. Leaf37]|uniref:DEAD/DEAH box helicase n=1 Tax=Sphingomonas sp. Leaf37 TaxID=2876552 RepID=UPI001E31DFB1|nr:AAA domain-containing protein [Sphingomonas sp. Leaf37]